MGKNLSLYYELILYLYKANKPFKYLVLPKSLIPKPIFLIHNYPSDAWSVDHGFIYQFFVDEYIKYMVCSKKTMAVFNKKTVLWKKKIQSRSVKSIPISKAQ